MILSFTTWKFTLKTRTNARLGCSFVFRHEKNLARAGTTQVFTRMARSINQFIFEVGTLDQGFWPDGIISTHAHSRRRRCLAGWDKHRFPEKAVQSQRQHVK